MTRPERIRAVVALGIVAIVIESLLLVSTTRAQPASNDQPNIVFVLADDLGWADINCFDPMNRQYYETPKITSVMDYH